MIKTLKILCNVVSFPIRALLFFLWMFYMMAKDVVIGCEVTLEDLKTPRFIHGFRFKCRKGK